MNEQETEQKPLTEAEATLAQLAVDIKVKLRGGLESCKEAGDLFRQARKRFNRDGTKWRAWLKVNGLVSSRSADNYIRISKGWDKLQAEMKRNRCVFGMREALAFLPSQKAKKPKQAKDSASEEADAAESTGSKNSGKATSGYQPFCFRSSATNAETNFVRACEYAVEMAELDELRQIHQRLTLALEKAALKVGALTGQNPIDIGSPLVHTNGKAHHGAKNGKSRKGKRTAGRAHKQLMALQNGHQPGSAEVKQLVNRLTD